MPVTRHVLITGGAGFVGSYAVRSLVNAGYRVSCLLRPSSDLWRIADLAGRFEIVHADLNALGSARNAVEITRPDTLVHLAWGGVLGSARNNVVQVDNIGPSIALMRAAVDVGCSHFVGLGSQAEYGPYEDVIREDFTAHPTTLYGVAKLATYMVLDRFAQETGISFAWMRLFSSYGPKDDPNWLLPSLILRLKRKDLPDLTKGEQLWDYIHVTDAASAIERVVATGTAGLFNLASGESRPLRNIVEAVRDLVDPGLPLEFGRLPYRPDQVMRLEADVTALRQAAGWSPATSLEEGLRETVRYYMECSAD